MGLTRGWGAGGGEPGWYRMKVALEMATQQCDELHIPDLFIKLGSDGKFCDI